jgi:DEAD/DEAH box helicase domain-containing protein
MKETQTTLSSLDSSQENNSNSPESEQTENTDSDNTDGVADSTSESPDIQDIPQRPTSETLKSTYQPYIGQVLWEKTRDPQDAQTVLADSVLPEELSQQYPYDPYTHQAEALNKLSSGENVCITTSTSSGKSDIYALHIARTYLKDQSSTAILFFPTKALARDQCAALRDLYDTLNLDISVEVYDGDTPSSERSRIRETADVVLTNFSAINIYLNDHAIWKRIFSHAETVVVDELHSYTGVQGMHTAWILRRFQRILDHYGSDPQFILTSATIGNPEEHAKNLTHKTVSVVDTDGSPRGKRDIVFWHPQQKDKEHEQKTPPKAEIDSSQDSDRENDASPGQNPPKGRGENSDGSGRYSHRTADQIATDLLAHLTKLNIQTLMFTRSRQSTEVNTIRARKAAESHHINTDVSIKGYNAGRGKNTRHKTEKELRTGDVDGVITTNALELGINIGSVDATILTGYPGTRQSFWQQLGRSGRNTNDSLSIFVPGINTIDQYLLDNPEHIFNSSVEDAVTDLQNNTVFAQHALCAANEQPLTTDDVKWFGDTRLRKAVDMFKKTGEMAGSLSTGVRYTGPQRPQDDISVYGVEDDQFTIICEGADIDVEPVNRERAYREFHPGAIHVFKGDKYVVTDFTENQYTRVITLEETKCDHYTRSITETEITSLEEKESKKLPNGITLFWGTGSVKVDYIKYQKRRVSNGQRVDSGEIDLPPISFQTQLLWLDIPESLRKQLTAKQGEETGSPFLGGVHAVEHGVIKLSPLELRLSEESLNGLTVSEGDVGRAYIYDSVKGGLGFSRKLFDSFQDITDTVEERFRQCSCTDDVGCPACTMDRQCSDQNEPLHKKAGIELLTMLNSRRQQ